MWARYRSHVAHDRTTHDDTLSAIETAMRVSHLNSAHLLVGGSCQSDRGVFFFRWVVLISCAGSCKDRLCICALDGRRRGLHFLSSDFGSHVVLFRIHQKMISVPHFAEIEAVRFVWEKGIWSGYRCGLDTDPTSARSHDGQTNRIARRTTHDDTTTAMARKRNLLVLDTRIDEPRFLDSASGGNARLPLKLRPSVGGRQLPVGPEYVFFFFNFPLGGPYFLCRIV